MTFHRQSLLNYMTMPVNVRFVVYTPNLLSLNGMSWYKTNYYSADPLKTQPLLLQLLVSEARY